MHYLGGVWMDVVGWAVVLVGAVLLASHLLLLGSRHRPPGDRALETAPRLDREREWELVMRRATRELARAPTVEELQANATVKIEAAELAYKRVVFDCSKLCDVPRTRPVELIPAPPHQTEEPAQEHEPLAA